MKFFKNLLLALTLITNSVAAFADTEEYVWPDSANRIVYFSPKPILQVSLNQIEATTEYWSQLALELNYDNPNTPALVRELNQRYRGYTIQRVMLDLDGDFTVHIPALNRRLQIRAMPGQTGPFFSRSEFLSQRETAVLLRNFNNESIEFSGAAQAQVPAATVTEMLQLPATTCNRLVAGASTLFDALRNFVTISNEIDGMQARHASSKVELKRAVLQNCLNMNATGSSFQELLALPVSRSAQATNLTGTTYGSGVRSRSISLHPDIVISTPTGR